MVDRHAQERMQIVADKKSYVPGDTAHVLIVTGKEPASVLVTAEGNGLYSAQVIKSNGGSITVDVPIQPEYAPNFYVSATFIRGNKLYQGNKSLSVPPTQHELKVDLQPSKPQYQPGRPAPSPSRPPTPAESLSRPSSVSAWSTKPSTPSSPRPSQHRESLLRHDLHARSSPTAR